MRRGCASGSIPASPRSGATIFSAHASSRSRQAPAVRSSCASPRRSIRAPGYVLPVRETDEIGAFSLAIEATGMARPPALRVAGESQPRWTSEDGSFRFAVTRRNVRLDGDIAVDPPQPAGTLLISRHANGERFFQIVDAATGDRREAPPMDSVAILWDRSLSRADDDLDKEIALVQAYLERVRPQAVDLILFDSGGAERVRVQGAVDLVTRLRAVRYRGATSLATIAGERLTGADACLLFSDGLVTIDRRDGFIPDCPLFAVSSATDADRSYLGSLAGGAGGEAFDLNVRGADEVLTRLTRHVPRVIDVRSTSGARIDVTLSTAARPAGASSGRCRRAATCGCGCPGWARRWSNASIRRPTPSPNRTAPAPCGRPSGPP
jgi:hypothetical protein